ncbi:MAG: sulfatase-like hydrolase/transferase [Bacteroidota bacterium]
MTDSRFAVLFKRFGILLLAYACCRGCFIAFNPVILTGATVWEIIKLFFYGIRFDIPAILIINAVFILAHIIPFPAFYSSRYQFWVKTIFYFFNIPALLFNLIDCVYFGFTQKRTTADFFTSEATGDLKFNFTSYLKDYWYLLILLLLFIAGIEFLYHRTLKNQVKRKFSIAFHITGFILSAGLFIIGVRGGIQFKPISMQTAARYTSRSLIPAMLNTPFAIIKTRDMESLSPVKFMSDADADKIYPVFQKFPYDSIRKMNVVIIILESFSKEYCGFFNNGEGWTPFLDSLCSKSVVFTNAYANSKRSIEGIPAIVASIPNLMDESFISSGYNTNSINGVAGLLKNEGYSGYFFHGGNNGTMGFENFSPLAGFSKYYGRNEYDGPAADYDGSWGIFDEPFYKFMYRKLDASAQPFCSVFFSLSSHHPFTIPHQYINSFPKGSQPLFESIGYADHSLKTFFDLAKKSTWFNNTLFVITADHTGPGFKPEATTSKGSFEIPVIFYSPSDVTMNRVDTSVMQHADIVPSILDYLHYTHPFSAFGHSIFRSGNHFAINYINSIYQGIDDRYIIMLDGDNISAIGFYDYRNDPLLKNNILDKNITEQKKLTTITKAALQQFRQHLLKNDLAR